MKIPRTEYHNGAATIHTAIDAKIKKKLLEYGKGNLNTGIETLIDIADKQKITINIVTEVTL